MSDEPTCGEISCDECNDRYAKARAEIEALRQALAEHKALTHEDACILRDVVKAKQKAEKEIESLQNAISVRSDEADGLAGQLDEARARAEHLQAAQARDAITNIGEELARIATASFDYFEESNQEKESEWFGAIGNTANFARTLYESPALKAIEAALAGDTAKPETGP